MLHGILVSMAGRSREKIALFIFTLLMVGGLLIAGAYMLATHSLNIAATRIDDIFGSMDDYTVLVYEGTIDPHETAEASDDSSDDAASDDAASGRDAADADDGAERGDSASEKDALADSASTSANRETADAAQSSDDRALADGEATPGSSEHLANDEAASESSADSDGGSAAPSDESESFDPIAALAKLAGSPLSGDGQDEDPVSVDEVLDEYRGKGAYVYELSVSDPSKYETGKVLTLGALRVGIFSTDDVMPEHEVESMVRYFDMHDVDVVVAVAPVRNCIRSLEGIDILVTTADAKVSTLGSTLGGTFVVQAPQKGSVGVIMITPSTIASSKVVAP